MNAPRTYGAAGGWLRLLRLPNLPTVPGDPIAGFMLARLSGGAAAPGNALAAVAAALLLYVAGLISNDCADIDEDRRDRPERPLPSDRVSMRSANLAWGAAALAGIACAAVAGTATALVALLLLGCVILYNYFAKSTRAASLVMGCCRGLSLVMGAVAGGWQPGWDAVVVAALGVTLYIAAVTAIAERETETVPLGARPFLPGLVVFACFGALFWIARPVAPLAFALAGVALAWVLFSTRRLTGRPEPPLVGVAIGRLIRGLLLLQAAWVALAGPHGVAPAAALLCLWPLSAILSRRYYAT